MSEKNELIATGQRYGPRELPDLRLRMAQFWDNPHNHPWIRILEESSKPLSADVRTELARLVRASLTEGELYYVAPELASLAAESNLPITQYGFMPWDLPSPAGLMYLDRGALKLTTGETRPVVLSWVTCQPDESAPHGILQVFIHAEKAEIRRELLAGQTNTERFDAQQPDYVLGNAVEIVFAESGGAIEYRTHHQEMGSYVLSLLFATCHLMRQTLAETSHEVPERGTRRRHQRAGFEAPSIRVMRIRGSERREATGESAREWHHRWIVRGHWRRQWYPSIEAHRPVWITPYVKGPEEAPLIGGEKVYTLSSVDQGDNQQ